MDNNSNKVKDKERLRELFEELRATGEDRIRDEIVESHLKMAKFFARRFGARSDQFEDLVQVATLGLINAVDRYDLNRGTEFATFASVTILGEIKRYFRDRTWGVKVPRRVKDLNVTVNNTIERLIKENDRKPTYAEIAAAIGCTVEEIIESREALLSYKMISLDKEFLSDTGEHSSRLMDVIGGIDKRIELLSDRLSLQSGLKQLKDSEKFVIYYRYFQNYSQAKIAEMLDVSQMQISRLQASALEKLKVILSK